MKKIIIVALIMFATSILYFGFYNGNEEDFVVGIYKKEDFYIELKNNGTFIANNYITLEGEYKVSGEKVAFSVKKLNGKKFLNKADGRLKGNELSGPDGFTYEKNIEE